MSPIIKDIVSLVADHIVDMCDSRFIRVTVFGRSCNHAKGVQYQEVIYIPENLFHDIREVIKRIAQGESLGGIVFAGRQVTSDKEMLLLLARHRASMDQDIVIRPRSLSFCVHYHFKPTESVIFSLPESPPHSMWWHQLLSATGKLD